MSEKLAVADIIVDYNFFRSGNQKPVVVLLHGWGVSKEVWTEIFDFLKENNFSVLCLDLPGFGGSSIPKTPWTVSDYARLVVNFLHKLNLSKIILVGHSFGGRISLVMSAENPELVAKLVLVDSAGIKTATVFKKLLSWGAKIVKPFFRYRFTSPIRKQIYKKIGAEDYVNTPELQKTFVNVIGEDLTKYLPKILQPTKIFWGKNDLATPIKFAHEFNKGIKNSSLVVFDNAGHYSFVDQSTEFKKELLAFLTA